MAAHPGKVALKDTEWERTCHSRRIPNKAPCSFTAMIARIKGTPPPKARVLTACMSVPRDCGCDITLNGMSRWGEICSSKRLSEDKRSNIPRLYSRCLGNLVCLPNERGDEARRLWHLREFIPRARIVLRVFCGYLRAWRWTEIIRSDFRSRARKKEGHTYKKEKKRKHGHTDTVNLLVLVKLKKKYTYI